jgi:solute carrier family 25 carnitine/acylcarnitine transporter 20/29
MEGGVRSLYRGTGMTLVREVPGTVAYFATYEYVKREIATMRGVDPNGGELSLPAVLVAGGLAGMAYWAIGVTVVADVVKSRYQTAPTGMYAGYADVYRALVRDGGYAGLFRGGRPAILLALPASMTCFLGVELTRKLFEYMD